MNKRFLGIVILVVFKLRIVLSQLVFEGRVSSESEESNEFNSIVGCPLRCLCFDTTVRCMFLQLEKIPQVSKETTVLDLRFNRIKDIGKGNLNRLKKLDTLLLNNNEITRIENGTFEGLSQLRLLYLYKNRIHEIQSHAFSNLTNLQQLYLHYNFITDLIPNTFSNLKSLQRLFLQNNRIQKIPVGSFENLHQMKRLRLDSNSLVCDCEMLEFSKMLADHPDTQAAAICQHPLYMQGKPVAALQEMQLECKKPVITEEPRDVEVNFGTTVYFSCKAEGDPAPKIVWLHNENEISLSNEPRYSILNDGTLMIANTRDEDSGTYECMAKSMAGEAKSRKANMETKKGQSRTRPRFSEAPKDSEVREGTSLVLKCSARGSPEPIIFWHLNDEAIINDPDRKVGGNGNLLIENIGKRDEGIYKCTASNSLGNVSTIAQVRIIVPPVWVLTPIEQTVQIGAKLNLSCESTGNPHPAITWTHNGRTIGLPNKRVLILNEGTQLKVNSVIQEDEGEYICKAENPGGVLEAPANIRVISGSSPTFNHNRERFPRVIESGSGVNLICNASGTPKPIIIWRKNGITVIESSRVSILPSGTLIINRFNPLTDTGTYECSAFNDHGFVSSEPLIVGPSGVNVGGRQSINDSVLLNAITQARRDVEKAENETLEILFGNMSTAEIRSPFDLLRLGRFPKAEARNIVRSAEIYERALQLIAKHAEGGMKFELDREFSYNELLSPTQLETLSRFSGCISHQKPKENCELEMCFHSKYRSITGACNNLRESMWGSSYTAFQRLLKPVYENGFNLPIGWNPNKLYNGHPKPLARKISSQIIKTERITPDLTYTHMLMQWGQFLDHDLDHALPSLSIESYGERISCRRTCQNVAPCFPMQAPEDDTRVRTRKCIEFTRSAAICGSGITSILFDTIQQREQINQLSSFIDASQVYGSSEAEIKSLQSQTERRYLRKGIYMFPNKPLMPFATDETPVDCRRNFRESDVGCFLGGDIRVNEQLGLLAMHTIWFRQHNFLADELKRINPSWEEEIIFQEARKIVGAQMQHITYAHWLPFVIGAKGMEILGPYRGYDPSINPTITTEFATAALRFGHTLINPVLRRLDSNFESIREGDLPLRSAFFSPWRLVEEGGLDPVMRGLFHSSAKLKKPDELLNSHLIEDLFAHAHLVALDLAAMNIQRGRDHGLPSYNEYRVLCNLTRAYTFNDMRKEIPDQELRRKLENVYKTVDNIDLWVGGVAEEPEESDSRVGPTFRCILIDQFKRLRDGDRFWYENPSTFRPEQLVEIKQSSLARVLCDNGDGLSHVKRDVFRMDSPLLSCSFIPSLQLGFWASDCCGGENRASCPYSLTTTNDNEIRRNKRSIDDVNENDIIINTNVNKGELSKEDEVLSQVKTKLETLENRINNLEARCSKNQSEMKTFLEIIIDKFKNLIS